MVVRDLVLLEELLVDRSLEDARNQEDGRIHQSALNQEGDQNRDDVDLRVLLLQLHIHLLLLTVTVKRNDLSLVDDIEVCHLRKQRKRSVQKVRKGVTDQSNPVDHIVRQDRGVRDIIGKLSKIFASKKI